MFSNKNSISEHIRNLLPIGSVVLLNGSEKKVMIIGQMQQEQGFISKKQKDYIGVVYPEGYISSQRQLMFDHMDIRNIVFMGYNNQERENFVNNLINFYSH